MNVNKITIHAGHIESARPVPVSDIDPDLSRAAQDAVTALREGTPIAFTPVAGGPELTVGLGMPPRSDKLSRRLREHWQELNPGADISEYEVIRQQVVEHQRLTGFYIAHSGKTYCYSLEVIAKVWE